MLRGELVTSPWHSVGTFVWMWLTCPDGYVLVREFPPGRIRLYGKVFDGEGAVIPDALIETWQADADGKFGTDFRGFGRSPTNDDGEWEIFTVLPGALGDGQAPHIDVNVFARGMLNRCITRIYFADSDSDPVLATVPAERRATLIATATEEGYRFDVHVQGEGETVFFKV